MGPTKPHTPLGLLLGAGLKINRKRLDLVIFQPNPPELDSGVPERVSIITLAINDILATLYFSLALRYWAP